MKVPSGLLLLALLAAVAYPCAAQPYPSRVMELVSPTGPGGGSDLVARTVADIVAMEKLLPQMFVVQNRAGGGGAVGQNYVAGRQGDPYTGYCLRAPHGVTTWRATCMRTST